MLFKNPKKGEMVIHRTVELQEDVSIRFISGVINNIIREVYAIHTKDENGKNCFVIKSSLSYDYGEGAPPLGIVGVAYSSKGACKMAHDYIKTKSEEIRCDYYPDYTLVDRVQVSDMQ